MILLEMPPLPARLPRIRLPRSAGSCFVASMDDDVGDDGAPSRNGEPRMQIAKESPTTIVDRTEVDFLRAMHVLVADVFDKLGQHAIEEEKARLAIVQAKSAERAVERKHQVELAEVGDKQLARREQTIRTVAPIAIIAVTLGTVGLLAVAAIYGKMSDAASALAVLALVATSLRHLIRGDAEKMKATEKTSKNDEEE